MINQDSTTQSTLNATPSLVTVPDYELLRCIGQGSYGEVWLARSVLGVYRAVKIVRRSRFENDRPFEREFIGIQKFEPVSRSHESQVQIFHVGRGDGYFYYVMDLADDQAAGEHINPETYQPKTLKSELARAHKHAAASVTQTALALTRALEHLHSHGLVHRDVKPSNIIYVRGIPKLADIGLVTTLDATRSFVGTEGYAPPEGTGAPQGDIYGLGKVLYEFATGRDRSHFPELPTDIADYSEREWLLEFNEVIAKACAPNPKDRYASAAAMHRDLLLLKDGQSVRHAHALQVRVKRAIQAVAILSVVFVLYLAGLQLRQKFTSNRQELSDPGAKGTIPTWGRIVDRDNDCAFSNQDGLLTITIPGSDHALAIERGATNAPRVLQPVSGDFIAQVKVSSETSGNFQSVVASRRPFRSAGLLVWQDSGNYARIECAEMMVGQRPFVFGTCELRRDGHLLAQDGAHSDGANLLSSPAAYLRCERRGIHLISCLSTNGRDWVTNRIIPLGFSSNIWVGVVAGHNTSTPFSASFSDFRVTHLPTAASK